MQAPLNKPHTQEEQAAIVERTKMTSDKRRAKVLLLDLGAHYGGVENYLVNLASLLRNDVDLYALCVLPELQTRLQEQGVTVVRLPIFAGLLKPLRFLLACAVLIWMILRRRIDSIQFNGLLESALILPTRLFGRAAVYTRHGPFELEYYSLLRHPHKFLPRKVAQLSLRLASHSVCVSEAVAESVKPILSPNRFTVIPNWVRRQGMPRPVRTDLTPSAEILCLSRLEHYKGIHLLLEATRSLPDIQVTIAGDGGFRKNLEEMAAGRTNVHFAGFLQNVTPLYERADIVVMPSLGPEGLPMTSLEAMGRGIPCIFSDLPVHSEISDGGKGASLFTSGNAESLQRALTTLLAQPEARHTLAREALRIVDSRYTDNRVRGAYLAVFAKENSGQ
ncbi:MAG TPA: glycosyltransferase family 4 protein [Edaphobacter sp.]|nr:glycosyltransferase family 4 protein [Edaphobacter sp.]